MKTFTLGGIWGLVTQYVSPVTITISAATVAAVWLLSKRRKSDPNVEVRNKSHQGGTGKRGIWFLLFLDWEFYCNTGKSLKTQGKYFDSSY